MAIKLGLDLDIGTSIGIEVDFTELIKILTLKLITMRAKVKEMKNSINKKSMLNVIGMGAQLESPSIPIARSYVTCQC